MNKKKYCGILNVAKLGDCIKVFGIIVLMGCLILLSGCGSLTGIPGHGGGKRFAVEQELVAAATRATIKAIDLTSLHGKKVNLFVNAIGDTGAGNLTGGRFSVAAQLRGEYHRIPSVGNTQLGAGYDAMGAYKNSEEISSNDLQYLRGLLQTYFFLKGVNVVPPSEVEIDVYITVDVFGTVRSRVEWFLANNEILIAKTVMEVMAVDHSTGQVVMPPQSASMEAKYNEQYILWAGPVAITKYLKKSKPLLSDFTDVMKSNNASGSSDQDCEIQYPFRYQLNK